MNKFDKKIEQRLNDVAFDAEIASSVMKRRRTSKLNHVMTLSVVLFLTTIGVYNIDPMDLAHQMDAESTANVSELASLDMNDSSWVYGEEYTEDALYYSPFSGEYFDNGGLF